MAATAVDVVIPGGGEGIKAGGGGGGGLAAVIGVLILEDETGIGGEDMLAATGIADSTACKNVCVKC